MMRKKDSVASIDSNLTDATEPLFDIILYLTHINIC